MVGTGQPQEQPIQVGAHTTVHNVVPIYSNRTVYYSIKPVSRLRLCPTNLLSLATPMGTDIYYQALSL